MRGNTGNKTYYNNVTILDLILKDKKLKSADYLPKIYDPN